MYLPGCTMEAAGKPPSGVRRADLTDINEVCRLIFAGEKEVGALLKPDHQKMVLGIANAIQGGRAFVYERDGRVVGSVGYEVGEWWFSSEAAVIDRWMYVEPEFRKSMAFGRLLKSMKSDADALGLRCFAGVGVGNIGPAVGIMERHHRKVAVTFEVEA